ncbi:MAG TPA: bifunctional serine/threonine-protein kinase/formylglycine-generating enzyme family protein [Rhabdochlamydiaceae bacterium]|nr:bifunctional serine/threonine-protein kinase/formylglycine-generating enzyme family protein [Rhabdochlamydiaceae bacterium]
MTKRSLGDYSLIKQIGQGALGTVFLAEHRFLKQPFAIKIFPEELSDDRSFIQRFEKEVTILATLDHPNIVKVHNATQADDKYFLVTDCIVDEDGAVCNLQEFLVKKKRKLSEEEIFSIAGQIASALDYVHQLKNDGKHFGHHGIKLNNILVRASKDQIQVYLTDFGLTRVIGSGAILSRTYKAVAELLSSHSGYELDKNGEEKYSGGKLDPSKQSRLHQSFVQSFAFLAPEQKVFDESYDLDKKSDTYAFGVLVYYLLLGQFPEGFFELPSRRRPELKGNWDQLIMSCLQSDPKKRPDSLTLALEESKAPAAKGKEAEAGHISKPEALKPVLKPGEISRPEFENDPGAIFQKETTVGHYQPQPEEEKNINPLLTEMAIIPAGHYSRGSNNGGRDEIPRHQIYLNAFAMDVHQVTNEQFVRFLEAMGGEKDVNNNDIIRLRESRIKRSGGRLNIESGYARHPIVGVTWYGAVAYAKWVGKRLPSEAEWEIASYGGIEDALFPTGDNIGRPQANFFSSDTIAVMSYPANSYGLYDVAGNVYEWCSDWYDYHYYDISVQEPDNPKGPVQGVYRVLRGGCWKSLKDDMRCSHRHRNNPGTMNGTYGFRCASDVTTA